MTTSSVSGSMNVLHVVDGVVRGPSWSEHRCQELLRSLQMTDTAFPSDFDAEEQESDVDVAALMFYEVLRSVSGADQWPVFAGSAARPSLFKAAVSHALFSAGVASLVRLDAESALAAVNVARWLLRLSQQSSPVLVFSRPPARRSLPVRRVPIALVS